MKRPLRLALVVAALLGGACNDAPSVGNGPDLFFATHPQGPAVMQALFRGPLVVQDGCVLVGSAREYSLPVWPEGFAAERDQAGRLIVRNAEGATIAIEGEVLEMGGGYTAEFRPEDEVEPREDQLRRFTMSAGYKIPQRCLGADVYGIWSVGETEPITA